MPKLTAMQQAFVNNKVAGMPNRQAALTAGYAVASAHVAASQLMEKAHVKAAIRVGKKAATAPASIPEDIAGLGFKAKYATSLDFMVDVMNNPRLPPGLRFEAAKQLLPYQHGRIGEKGKKEKAVDRAHAVTGGKGRGKFTPKSAPPSLHVVGGKG